MVYWMCKCSVWEWDCVQHCHCSPVPLTSNDQVAEEEPTRDEGFFGGARRFLHDVNVRWIEAKCSGRKSICH